MTSKKLIALSNSIDLVYDKYSSENKYYTAKLLYRLNKEFYYGILELDFESVKDLADVILHFNAWFTEFEIHEREILPSKKDDFVFSSSFPDFRYPKDIIDKILNL